MTPDHMGTADRKKDAQHTEVHPSWDKVVLRDVPTILTDKHSIISDSFANTVDLYAPM